MFPAAFLLFSSHLVYSFCIRRTIRNRIEKKQRRGIRKKRERHTKLDHLQAIDKMKSHSFIYISSARCFHSSLYSCRQTLPFELPAAFSRNYNCSGRSTEKLIITAIALIRDINNFVNFRLLIGRRTNEIHSADGRTVFRCV